MCHISGEIFTRNASYINPEDALPYRSGSVTERKTIIERLCALKNENVDATCEKTPSENCAYEVIDSSATKVDEKLDSFCIDLKHKNVDATYERTLSENCVYEVIDSSATKVKEKLDSCFINQFKDENEKTIVCEASKAISQALETASIVVNEKLDSFSIDQSKDKNEKTIVCPSEVSISQALETASSDAVETSNQHTFRDLLKTIENQGIDGHSNLMADISCKEVVNHGTSDTTRFRNDVGLIQRYISLLLLHIVLFQ